MLQLQVQGEQVWAVGSAGTLLRRRAAAGWTRQTLGGLDLQALQLHPDGRHAWIAGRGGTLLSSGDAGQSWSAQPSGVSDDLHALLLHPDGRRLWAAGDGARLLRSADGGASWQDALPYARFWAPWAIAAWVVLSAALGLLLLFVRPRGAGDATATGADPPSGAATILASDHPVFDKSADLLGHRAIVEALSSFIRNRATEPRVTLAISGEWGSGKSSVMRMLQTDLERAGFRSAWFNAWHQQQEGRPLAALFQTIRLQAVPHWWRQPLAALRVRSRLIWARGPFYRLVALACLLGIGLLFGDLLAEGLGGPRGAAQRLVDNWRFHVLQERPSHIGRESLLALQPFARAKDAAPPTLSELWTACESGAPARADAPLRAASFCALSRQLLPERELQGLPHGCRVREGLREPCVFDSLPDLLATAEAALGLNAGERAAIAKAAQTLSPPPLLRWFESSLLSGAAGFALLLFTKGVSVYNLQLLAPLKGLLGQFGGAEEGRGKEASGTVERYRHEFRLLCEALDGRLVVFIDDLDRCTPETVNGMLELSNYMVDVGRCFVVLGAAMQRVKQCVRSPVASDDPERYATEYLRKLVHVEMPIANRPERLGRLIDGRPELERAAARRWLGQRGRRWGGYGLALMASVLAFGLGADLQRRGDGRVLPLAAPLAFAGPASGAVPAAAPPGAASAPTPSLAAAAHRGPVGLQASDAPPRPPWPLLFACLGALALIPLLRSLAHRRAALVVALGGALRETDAADFLAALRLWNPVVLHHDPTPRQVKRFYNRTRLLAAYERQQEASALDEPTLVALAALHHLGLPLERWQGSPDLEPLMMGTEEGEGVLPLLAAHRQRFGRLPSAAQVRAFLGRVEGLQVR